MILRNSKIAKFICFQQQQKKWEKILLEKIFDLTILHRNHSFIHFCFVIQHEYQLYCRFVCIDRLLTSCFTKGNVILLGLGVIEKVMIEKNTILVIYFWYRRRM